MAYYSGKSGFVTVAATRIPLEEWTLELEVEEVDATNFESYGMNTIMSGIRGGTISASGPYESVTDAGVLVTFQAGTVVSVELGVFQTGTLGFTVNVILTGLTIGNNVREKPTFEFSGTLTNIDSSGVIQSAQNQTIVQA